MSIALHLDRLRSQVAAACDRAHRDPASVQLMAVSKYHPVSALLEAYAAGQRLFGENRVQEIQAKRPALAGLDGLQLHLIGPLQSNKTSRAAELCDAVDSLDSIRTAQRLSSAATALGKLLPVLLEVKLSPEPTKHGIPPEDLPELLAATAELPGLHLAGLMTVPPFTPDPAAARPCFQRLRQLRDTHSARYPTLTQLSMGMSHDFEIAIAEGSTCIRIGTALFGPRTYPAPVPAL